jgi:hypothetical protein
VSNGDNLNKFRKFRERNYFFIIALQRPGHGVKSHADFAFRQISRLRIRRDVASQVVGSPAKCTLRMHG